MGVVVVLLLLLSGDVETNPGPVGEIMCLTVSDVSPVEPDCHTKSFFVSESGSAGLVMMIFSMFPHSTMKKSTYRALELVTGVHKNGQLE